MPEAGVETIFGAIVFSRDDLHSSVARAEALPRCNIGGAAEIRFSNLRYG
jgi:hypothetical protein